MPPVIHSGEDCEVATLTEHDVRRYEAARRAGGIQRRSGGITKPVRAQTVAADLVTLNTMLRWATTVREPNGTRWLQENPLAGIRRPREPNPRRPIATCERFAKTRDAMQQLMGLRPGIRRGGPDGPAPVRQVARRRGADGGIAKAWRVDGGTRTGASGPPNASTFRSRMSRLLAGGRMWLRCSSVTNSRTTTRSGP